MTNVFAKEADLSRICPHCKDEVGKVHKEGQKRDCPSKPDGITKHRHLTFCVQSISGTKRFPIAFKSPESLLDDQSLSDLKAKYEAKTRKHSVPQPKGALDEAKLLAAGIVVIYKTTSHLGWGLGVVEEVALGAQDFTIVVFAPTVRDVHESAYGKWTTTKKQLVLKSSTDIWMRAKKPLNRYGYIHTRVLGDIRADPRFEWKWRPRLFDATKPPDELQMSEPSDEHRVPLEEGEDSSSDEEDGYEDGRSAEF